MTRDARAGDGACALLSIIADSALRLCGPTSRVTLAKDHALDTRGTLRPVLPGTELDFLPFNRFTFP